MPEYTHSTIRRILSRKTGDHRRGYFGHLEGQVDLLLRKILDSHDFGPWSKVSLDGLIFGGLIVTDETDTSITTSGIYAMLGNKNHEAVPIMLRLDANGEELNYNVKLERAMTGMQNLPGNKLWKDLHLLAHGDLLRDWDWIYENSGAFD